LWTSLDEAVIHPTGPKASWQSFLLLIRDTLAMPNPEKHICPQYDVVYRITASVMETAQKATEEAQAAEAAQ
jgi:hypothetical protein